MRMNPILNKIFRRAEVPFQWFHLNTIIYYSSILAFFAHLIFFFVFNFLHVEFMSFFNLLSCSVFLCCFLLCRQGRVNIALVLFMGEVIAHACFSVFFTGWDSGFHIYIICMVPLLFFHPTYRTSVRLSLTLLFCAIYLILNFFRPNQGTIPVEAVFLQQIRFLNFIAFFVFMAAYSFYYKIASRYTEDQIRLQNIKLAEAHHAIQKESEKREKALVALQRSEEIFRTIVTNSLPIIFCIDKNGIFTLAEGKSLEALGQKPGEMVGKSIQTFSKDYPDILKGIQVTIEGKIFSDTVSFQGAKEKVSFDILYSPYRDSQGQIVGTIGIANDITERKKAELENKKLADQLQRAEKMEAIGTLAGGVAHDLNNILAGIVGYPDLLLMELAEDNPLRESIKIIKESGQKAAEIVQDLLTLARRGVPGRDILNLNDIIRDYWRSPEFEILKSLHVDIQFDHRLDDGLLNLAGSRVHIFKTIMNLVSNAAEAVTQGGSICITTENRYVDQSLDRYERITEGDYVILQVSDTGVGISAEDRKRIFEPFYTKKEMGRSGTGLGLAVVWGTVKDHNGFVDIVSHPGKGTTFTLYFPASRELKAQDPGVFSLNDFRGQGETVLVIDDVKEQRDIATRMLSFLGYTVTSVESGEAAVDYMRHHSVDLLLLDMIMDPGMDGLDCYKEIIKLHPHQKAVIASGYSETHRVRQAQACGASTYLKKPYTIDKIAKILRSELQKPSNPHSQ